MLPKLSIRVEAFMSNPPKPGGLAVVDEDNNVIGLLAPSEVLAALKRFEEMQSAWEGRHSVPDEQGTHLHD